MAGVKGRSGGRRPGAGPKRKEVKDWQHRNLLVLQSTFGEADVRQIADALKQDLKAGNPDARKVGLAYVFGAAPKEVTVTGDDEAPVTIRELLIELPEDPDGE